MSRSPDSTKIAIVGGGPAGLSLARMLSDQPGISCTVFESQPQIGGKSSTFSEGGVTCEMGTCYATRKDDHVRGWMKELNVSTRRAGIQSIEGTDFFDWVSSASRVPAQYEVVRYYIARRRFMKRLAARPNDSDIQEEASRPVIEWLNARKFSQLERLHYRGVTNMGYGALDEVSTYQALNWLDLDVILSGKNNDLLMPDIGWTALWQKITAGLDIRTSMPVTQIERHAGGVNIQAGAEQFAFDALVCTIPIDDFARLTEPTESESFVASAVEWQTYVTTLMAVRDWFHDVDVRCYAPAITLGAQIGQMMSARYEDQSEELGGDLYVINQLGRGMTQSEVNEIAEADIRRDGGTPVRAIDTRMWKYFPQYNADAICDGLLTRLQTMQGQQRTWYSGATFSHEAISHITRFNHDLAPQLAKQVRSLQQGVA